LNSWGLVSLEYLSLRANFLRGAEALWKGFL
jgi:hypothetical protein